MVSSVTVVLFEGFEPLDVFGPVELFSMVPELRIDYIGPGAGPIASSQGAQVVATAAYADAGDPGLLLVPGGHGTRALVEDEAFLSWLAAYADTAAIVGSVCTGSGVLAAAGLLDGYRATSNKVAFRWAESQGPRTTWIPQARWVEDGNRWTSSGVAAGMDMAAALIGRLWGREAAEYAAEHIELEVHRDPDWDPFAALNGLVDPTPRDGRD